MKLVTFVETGQDARRPAAWRCGALLSGSTEVVDVAAAFAVPGQAGPPLGPDVFLEWFDLDGPWLGRARRVLDVLAAEPYRAEGYRDAGVIREVASIDLLAPIPRPGKIVCVGLNYRDHAREARMEVPSTPVVFAKFPSAVIGSGAPIVLPRASDKIDFEAELGVVIGRRVRGIAAGEALGSVAGYLNANDVSARDFQKLDGQWVRAKSCDTFAPMGPALVTPDEVGDPGGLDISLRLNGATMQSSNTREFVFDVPALISFVAEAVTLEPGDVILTGTPPGVGFARRPPVYLRAGDIVEVEISGLGVLRNPVVAEPA